MYRRAGLVLAAALLCSGSGLSGAVLAQQSSAAIRTSGERATAMVIGNTLLSEEGEGRSAAIFFDASGRVKVYETPGEARATGSWSIKDRNLCVLLSGPDACLHVEVSGTNAELSPVGKEREPPSKFAILPGNAKNL